MGIGLERLKKRHITSAWEEIMGVLSNIFGRAKKVEPIVPNYPLLIENCFIDKDKFAMVKYIVDKNWTPNKGRYLRVSEKCRVPAWVIFCIHWKEASCSFTGALHNGDAVIGNGKKTYNEPKNRGPFNSWEETAIDALLLEKNKFPFSWGNIASVLEFCEKYNGLGHRTHGELSPYVWAYTNNHDETGNYVSDGMYDASAPIRSAGVASLLLMLDYLGEVKLTQDKQFILS
jgi:lysozyme family protein